MKQKIISAKNTPMTTNTPIKRITTKTIFDLKAKGEKITMLTAYDYTMAKLLDSAGVEILLVGDSAANVMAGFETTLPITLDHMIYHAQSVVRAAKKSLVVVDLPFGSYQSNSEKALESAIRIMKESECHAIKLEGGQESAEAIRKIVAAGIPVMGHLGLQPQSIYQYGSYAVRATAETEAQKLLTEIKLLEDLGCFAVVLEKIPAKLAAEATKAVTIPTIGIGAGSQVDGQVLVTPDFLGLNYDFSPRFLRRYRQLGKEIEQATKEYIRDVKSNEFPSRQEEY